MKISIVTATRNRCDWLPRCIESVATQSYENKEHIIIDGGSTDGTHELLANYAKLYPHLRWVVQESEGLSQAFNEGLALMTGDVVGIIGDDDFYEPKAFDTVAAALADYPQVGFVTGNCAIIDNSAQRVKVMQAAFSNRHDLIQFWNNWGSTVVLPAPSTFIQRFVIESVGGFEANDRYAMDYRHWIKITAQYPVHITSALLASFRWDEGSISYSAGEKQWQETLTISREYWGPKWSLSHWKFAISFSLFRQRQFFFKRIIPMTPKPLKHMLKRLKKLN